MAIHANLTLRFSGNLSESGIIDFYDVQRALGGFQRSLAITTHFAINGEIITQAPSLKNAQIFAIPPEQGSWKFPAIIASIGMSAYALGTAPQDTPIGHLISSLYDYALYQTMGVELDYDQLIRELIDEHGMRYEELPAPERLDSLTEKIRPSVIEMHRPIEKGTAQAAEILRRDQPTDRVGPEMDRETLDEARYSLEGEVTEYRGQASSYNMNTYSGRIYLPNEYRTVPFELGTQTRSLETQRAISRSLDANIAGVPIEENALTLTCIPFFDRLGRIKKLIVLNVE